MIKILVPYTKGIFDKDFCYANRNEIYSSAIVSMKCYSDSPIKWRIAGNIIKRVAALLNTSYHMEGKDVVVTIPKSRKVFLKEGFLYVD